MYLNDVVMIGTVARDLQVSYTLTGALQVRSTLCLTETRDGRDFKTYIPIVCFGKAGEALDGLPVGSVVLVKGKVAWRLPTEAERGKGSKGSLEIAVWSVQPLTSALQQAEEVTV
jgi:single-stranded DNA-binding protein